MTFNTIAWGRAVAGAILVETLLIAAAFGWVAIYSYLIDPGQPVAVYERHALVSSPWVSIVAGIPLFYSAARWVARNRSTALALVAIVLVFDATVLMLAASAGQSAQLGLVALSYISKILATWFGARAAEPEPALRTR